MSRVDADGSFADPMCQANSNSGMFRVLTPVLTTFCEALLRRKDLWMSKLTAGLITLMPGVTH